MKLIFRLGTPAIVTLLFSQGLLAQAWEPANEYTVREIMASMIQPASNLLWNPGDYDDMGNTVLPTDEESLQKLRWAATNLGAAASAINRPGQLVEVPGIPSPNPSGLSSDEMNALKKDKYEIWIAFSHALESLAKEYETAIEAGKGEAFGWSEGSLGNKMNNVCSACHNVFWYPNAPE